jgi:hypothetical protein
MSKRAGGDKDWKNDPLENTPPVRGSGNFLKDRGYADPTETRIKFDLVTLIRTIVESKKLRQVDVVTLVGRYAPGAALANQTSLESCVVTLTVTRSRASPPHEGGHLLDSGCTSWAPRNIGPPASGRERGRDGMHAMTRAGTPLGRFLSAPAGTLRARG